MKNADKLPKWAQYEIMLLERKLDELQKIVDADENPDDTNVTYGVLKSRGLPNNSTVSFHTDDSRFDVTVDKKGGIKIYSIDVLSITTSASNVVIIKPARDS